jgi:hypothetical protein
MNLERRWRCPAHPDTTIGATPGEPEPMPCPRCGQAMTLVDMSRQPTPRRQQPGRPETTPL